MANKPTHGGPGRGTPRTRTAARPTERGARPVRRTARTEENVQPGAPSSSRAPRLARGVGFTRRAIAMMVVLAVLLLSYASSLRVYLRQERELATAQQQIAERTQANSDLQYEIKRWDDPNFVKAQARQRLGWVVPGEVGYRVVDANGNPIDSSVTISTTGALPQGEHPAQWWDRLSGSLAAADQPLVAPSSQPAVSEAPSPTPTPTTKH